MKETHRTEKSDIITEVTILPRLSSFFTMGHHLGLGKGDHNGKMNMLAKKV